MHFHPEMVKSVTAVSGTKFSQSYCLPEFNWPGSTGLTLSRLLITFIFNFKIIEMFLKVFYKFWNHPRSGFDGG